MRMQTFLIDFLHQLMECHNKKIIVFSEIRAIALKII